MHGEGRHADIHLVTDLALFGIVLVNAPVSLPVALQVGGGGIMLSTVTACVFRLFVGLLLAAIGSLEFVLLVLLTPSWKLIIT